MILAKQLKLLSIIQFYLNSVTRAVVARSPKLMYQTSEHSGSNWNLEVLVFRREETNNKLDPYNNRTPGHMGGGASALTTAPFLLSAFYCLLKRHCKFLSHRNCRRVSNHSHVSRNFVSFEQRIFGTTLATLLRRNVVIYHFFIFHFVLKQKFARWQTRNANQETYLLSWLAVPTSPPSSPLESSSHLQEKDIPAINTR